MGYFDGLADASFKKDNSGNSIFYPWGIIGSGFILDSEETKSRIRKFLKTTYLVSLLTIVIVQVTVGAWLNLLLLALYSVGYYFIVKKMTKTLEVSSDKLSLAESHANSAKSHGMVTLVLSQLFSLGFIGVGVYLLLKGENSVMTICTIVFFGLCSLSIASMILAKIKQK